jgi:hypothetical protein
MRNWLARNAALVFSTIVLGAIGSGVWELFGPVLPWIGSAILNVATLGLQQLRDGLYVVIARGSGEYAATALFGLFSGLLTAGVSGQYGGCVARRKKWELERETREDR